MTVSVEGNEGKGVYIPIDQIYQTLTSTTQQMIEFGGTLRGIDRNVAAVVDDLKEHSLRTMKDHEDHESRLRDIEKWKNRLPVAIGGGVVSGILALINIVIRLKG